MAKKSPCLECDHHLAGGSKSDRCCMDCRARVDYVSNIGCLASSVPDHMTDYVETSDQSVVKIQKQETVMETKICKDEKCDFKGIPQPIDDFQVHGPSGRRFDICRTCQRRKIKAGHRKRVKKSFPESTEQPKTEPGNKRIIIDFSKHGDIYDELLEMAKEQLRSPENQILFIFKLIYERGMKKIHVAEQLKFP